jgi:hypothetical protein
VTLQQELRGHAGSDPWPPLLLLLEGEPANSFFQEFTNTDEEAKRLRRNHRRVTRISAGLGIVLLLVALFAEKWKEQPEWFLWAEFVLGLVVIAAVLTGVFAHLHHRWLSTRIRAERLRLLFFAALTDAEFWRTGQPRSGWFRLKDIELREWAKGGSFPEIPGPDRPVPRVPEGIAPFYGRARLAAQIEYFEAKLKRESGRWWDDPAVVQFVFFASIILIVVHALMRITNPPPIESLKEWYRRPDEIVVFFAAAIPTIFAGFKTLRSSNEFARNTARAKAKLSQLVDLDAALKNAKDAWTVISTMQLSEALLEEEQREWARLMTEAEWFG